MSRKSGFGRSIEEYVVGGELGRGGFATVHQAQCCNTGYDVAIKKIERRQIDERGMRQRVKEEVDIHARLDHPSILRLYHFFEDSQYVYLVLELCRNGELQKSLKNMDRVLYENEARVCLLQIVQGMLYLHSNSIMHRDLTLSNILIDDSGCLKIADFGLATRLSHPNDRHTTMCGTPNYISPEVVTRDPHGLESDVWSLGCMMYVMLVGHAPFDTRGVKEAILTRVANAEYEVPSNLSAEARSLIVACLQKNPKKRIPLKNVLLHPFMVGSKDGEPSDSGLYTMTTMATTLHPRAALFAITEERSEMSRREAMSQANICSEPFLRHPPSPPVRMKSNPRNLLPSYTGIIDNLKRKYTPLPSLRRGEDFAFTAPSLPPFSKRERDVSEERQRLQLHQEREEVEKHWKQGQVHEREVSHERQKQHHQQNPVSDARYSYSSQSSTTGRLDRVEANPQNHNNELGRCAYNYLPTPILPQHSRTSEEIDYSDSNDNRQGGHNMRERGCNSYSDHRSRSLERGSGQGHDEIIGEVRGRPVRRFMETGDRSGHRHLSQSRDRLEGEQEPNTSLSISSHIIGKSVHQPRSRSVDNYQGGSRVSHRAHSCCQGSQDHRSWCDRRVVADKEDLVYGGSRHSENESRHCSSNSKDQRFASVETHQASSRHHSTQENQQDKILNNIPCVFHPPPPAKNFNITSVPPQQAPPRTPTKQISASISRPSLSQQVSPISSHRLKKVRYPSKRYLLNILENGEVCLEQLKIGAGQQQQQKVVEDVCWISPDGFRIVIYQPDRGRGYVSGDMPPPKPEKGGDHFSYDNLPTKYWRKYKDAARFVKLVKSRTTKITYYSKEAKFYLMENSPDPDFVALFYHGTKVTKSKNSVVVREPIGVSHPVSYNTSPASLPDYLHSLYEHFKQAHAHCLHLDHVLSEATNKTGLSCFPVILGRKLPSSTTTPPLAAFPTAPATTPPSQGGGHQDKENLSPSSSASSFRARNNLPQLPSFEGSMVSTQVTNPQNTPPPLVRIPFTNRQPSNSLQAVRAHTPPVTQESPVCVNIPNIGRAYKEQDELRVDYINGAQIWTTSNSPQLKYRPNSNAELKLYTTSETLSQDLKEKLGEFPGILSALKKKQLMEQKQENEKIMVRQEITRTCHSSSLR